jgi:hypothetical protein
MFTHFDLSDFGSAYLELQISDFDDLYTVGKLREITTILNFTIFIKFGLNLDKKGLEIFWSCCQVGK